MTDDINIRTPPCTCERDSNGELLPSGCAKCGAGYRVALPHRPDGWITERDVVVMALSIEGLLRGSL